MNSAGATRTHARLRPRSLSVAARRLARWSCLLWIVLAGGCFKTKDELTLQPDGSGTVRLETRTRIPAEVLASVSAEMGQGFGSSLFYPPILESEAKKFFPGKGFTVAVTEATTDGEHVMVVEVSFKDVNTLLASPYAKAHALDVKIESGQFRLRAVSGIESAARFSDVKSDSALLGGQFTGIADLDKLKKELRSEFRVTLPNAVAAATGTRDGRTITWVTERSRAATSESFAQQAAAVLEASCPADGLHLAPIAPLHLGAASFQDVPGGTIVEGSSALDAKKVAASAKFIPHTLRVTRALDLSGDGGAEGNETQLMGELVLPHEYAPQKWGAVKIEEVIDARGNNLKSRATREDYLSRMPAFNANEENDSEDKPATPAEARRAVSLQFQSPEWRVKEITRIKASISLQYLGGVQRVLKVTNAVPAAWIAEAGPDNAFDMGGARRTIASPEMASLGLSLNLQMAQAQSGLTLLMGQLSGNKVMLSEAQVYDADGHPWPTFFSQQAMGSEGSCSITIAGRPKAPLSLAFRTTAVGAQVDVPIVLENVPVGKE